MAEKEMVDLKRPKEKRKHSMGAMSDEDYSYGLQLRLENHELDKLDMSLPNIGREFKIVAVGKVVSVHESKSENSKGDRGVQIQITKMSLK